MPSHAHPLCILCIGSLPYGRGSFCFIYGFRLYGGDQRTLFYRISFLLVKGASFFWKKLFPCFSGYALRGTKGLCGCLLVAFIALSSMGFSLFVIGFASAEASRDFPLTPDRSRNLRRLYGPLNLRRHHCRLPARFEAVLRGVHSCAHTSLRTSLFRSSPGVFNYADCPTVPFACKTAHLQFVIAFGNMPTGHPRIFGVCGALVAAQRPSAQPVLLARSAHPYAALVKQVNPDLLSPSVKCPQGIRSSSLPAGHTLPLRCLGRLLKSGAQHDPVPSFWGAPRPF